MVMTKEKLHQVNNSMLGLGEPVEWDNKGYNKIDYNMMYDLALVPSSSLTTKQICFIAKTLNKYKNTQLTEYKTDLEDTIAYYTKERDKSMVSVVMKTEQFIQITFPYNAELSASLKSELDKSQYRWVKDNGWKLNVNWNYIPRLVQEFQKYNLDCEQLINAYNDEPYHPPVTTFSSKKLKVKRSKDIDTLELQFDYSPDIVDVLHSIPNATWDKTKKVWRIQIESAATLYEKLPCSVDKSQLKYWSDLVNSWNTSYQLVDYHNYKLKFTPYDFQPTDADYLLSGKTILNANEVGCGKTFEMVLVGESIPLPKLVICPATLRLNWEKEIHMVNSDAVVHIQYSDKPFQIVSGWNIIGYPSLTKFQTELEKANFQVIMADEAHYVQAINNYGQPNSQRAKAVLRLAATAAYVFPITGTPKTSRNKNLYNILRMIRHPLTKGFGAFQKYGRDFCNGEMTAYGWDYNGNSNDDYLNQLLTPYMVRHLKRDVLPHIQKQRQSIPVSINLREYSRLIDEFMRHHKSNSNKELVQLTKAKQYLAIQKAQHSIDFAKTFIESGEKVVIVTCYTEVVQKVEKAFNCVKLVGGMSDKAKQQAINEFQYGKTPVIVINVVAGGVGVTLTAAHTMIINDLPWVTGEIDQAEGRIWRAGQTEIAMIYFMTAAGCPMDELLTNLITSKSQTINAAIDGGTGEEINFQDVLLQNVTKLKIK